MCRLQLLSKISYTTAQQQSNSDQRLAQDQDQDFDVNDQDRDSILTRPIPILGSPRLEWTVTNKIK